jgi:uncharacterized protein YjbI with pentapeptide repeats
MIERVAGLLRVLLVLALFACASTWAQRAAQPRVAMVIANGAYQNPKDRLAGPQRDADMVTEALKKVGFEVMPEHDLTKAQLHAALLKFRNAVRDSGPTTIAFFYYAGHGGALAQGTGSANYIFPVDTRSVANANPETEGESVRGFTELLSGMDARPAVALVFDACRTVEQAKGAAGTGAASTLTYAAPDDPPRGHLYAFSAKAGQSASDNSAYALALSEAIKTPGLTLDQVFEQTRIVVTEKNKNQDPMFRSNIGKGVCLSSCAGASIGDALNVLKKAMELRSTGDLGQVAAAGDLVREGKSLSGLDLQGMMFQGVKIEGAVMTDVDAKVANFEQGQLDRADLSRSTFAFARMKGASLAGGTALQSHFYFVEGDDGSYAGLKGQQSNWIGASLKKANFKDAMLQGASFMFADLRNADFRGADLRGTFFIGALLAGAKFDGAQVVNTDLSGAFASVNQFSARQQEGLCGTLASERSWFGLRLRRFDDAAPSGKYREIVSTGVQLRSGMRFLEPCKPRSLVADGSPPIFQGRGEELAERFTLDFTPNVMDTAGRENYLRQRLASAVQVLGEAWKAQAPIVIPGKRYKDLLSELERAVANPQLLSPAKLDQDALFLYQVRFHPETVIDETWRMEAESALALGQVAEANAKFSGRLLWSKFFPPWANATELAPAHIEVFKRWTANRARQFPTRIPVDLNSPGIAGKLSNMQNAESDSTHTPQLVVYPLAEFSTPAGIKDIESNYGVTLVDPTAVMVLNGIALRSRKSPATSAVAIPRRLAAVVRKQAKVAGVVDVRGIEVMGRSDRPLRVIQGDVTDMQIRLSDGTTVQ